MLCAARLFFGKILNIAAYEALMAFYGCIDIFFSSYDLGETAKQEGLGNQIYLTGKQLKSSAAD